MTIPDFTGSKILVVGDVMLDRYIFGAAIKLSPEAPVPVIGVGADEYRLGGAANVAANISALGARCDLISIVGNDERSYILKTLLNKHVVNYNLVYDEEIKTIEKVRVVADNQQLVRFDYDCIYKEDVSLKVVDRFVKSIENNTYDLVVLSDYMKGSLYFSKEIIKMAKEKGIPVIVDPKSKDFGDYFGATVITPNLKEYKMALYTAKLSDLDVNYSSYKMIEKYDFKYCASRKVETVLACIQKIVKLST